MTRSDLIAGCDVQLRPMPYPYRAMLAICSDLDETPDRRVFWEIMRFLNTTEQTSMGRGVGLEVGNSIYFDMPPGQFAYWNTDDAGREMVRTLVRSGYIDCLHSYGDLATTRQHAARVLDELARHDCKLEVWVDHGTAATNFGPDIMQGHGDEPGHEAYHADLTIDHGVKYICRGRVTSIIGQDIPARLGGLFNWKHPAKSGRTTLKEIAKRKLAQKANGKSLSELPLSARHSEAKPKNLAHASQFARQMLHFVQHDTWRRLVVRIGSKYAMHGPNATLRSTVLRDGNSAYEFMRCNPHWGGVSSCDQGRHVGKVLTDSMLDRLIRRGGTCILYTHLGKIDDPNVPFNKEAVKAFRRLANEFETGRILVTTTRRLLGYRRAVRETVLNSTREEKGLRIELNTQPGRSFVGQLPETDLCGLTFYVPEPETTSVTINGQEAVNLKRNPPDHTGQPSVSIPWPRLQFPDL